LRIRRFLKKNIRAAAAGLSKISIDLDETLNEGFCQLYEFTVAAIEYNKLNILTVNTTKINQGELKSQPKQSQLEQWPYLKKIGSTHISQSPSKLAKKTLDEDSISTVEPTQGSLNSFKTELPSRRSSHENTKTDMNYSGRKTSVPSTIAATTSNLQGNSSAHSSKSPIRNVTGDLKKSYKNTSYEKRYFTHEAPTESAHSFANDNSYVSEEDLDMSIFHNSIAMEKKEATNFMSKTKKLLADHERYVKRTLKDQESKKEQIERENQLLDRKKLIEYIKYLNETEKSYLKDLKTEKVVTQREIKQKDTQIQEHIIQDEMIESLKTHCFVINQNEKKKE